MLETVITIFGRGDKSWLSLRADSNIVNIVVLVMSLTQSLELWSWQRGGAHLVRILVPIRTSLLLGYSLAQGGDTTGLGDGQGYLLDDHVHVFMTDS